MTGGGGLVAAAPGTSCSLFLNNIYRRCWHYMHFAYPYYSTLITLREEDSRSVDVDVVYIHALM